MATWEDGPEYAPLERPDDFSVPSADPLEIVPPAYQSAAQAPKDRPQFDGPRDTVAPLSQLIPVVADQRDPGQPFAVVSSTLTSTDSAWGSAHWSSPHGPSGSPLTEQAAAPTTPRTAPAYGGTTPRDPLYNDPAHQPWGAPPVTSWPSPQAPLPPVGGPAQLPGGYPPPGTPQWFGPGPDAPPPPQPPAALDAKAVVTAATPGLLICLVIGGLIYLLAPIMLGLAFVLSSRVKVAQQQIRQGFYVALGFLGFFALAGLVTGRLWFTDWWSFVGGWSLAICWAMLVTVLLRVYRALKRRTPTPPPYTSNWG